MTMGSEGSEDLDGMLHITSGDIAGGSLAKADLSGEVFVWHDIITRVCGKCNSSG